MALKKWAPWVRGSNGALLRPAKEFSSMDEAQRYANIARKEGIFGYAEARQYKKRNILYLGDPRR
jgi:hypothetical protein